MSYTPEEITEILEAYFESIAHRQYIGARYVPIFGRVGESSCDWDNTGDYEPLTIVLYQGNSYTSRQFVPAGADISNTDYWVLTGNFNAQVEQYRVRLVAMENALPIVDFDATNTIKKYIDDVAAVIPASSFDDTDTVKKYIDDANAVLQSEKVQVFETVADMKAYDGFVVGMVCRTAGFHAANDGGAAWYSISDSGTANEMDIIACGDFYALFIPDSNGCVKVEQLGAYGDNSHDDSAAIQYAISNFSNIVLSKTYVAKEINVTGSFKTIEGGTINIPTGKELFVFNTAGSNIAFKNMLINGDNYSGTVFKFETSKDIIRWQTLYQNIRARKTSCVIDIEGAGGSTHTNDGYGSENTFIGCKFYDNATVVKCTNQQSVNNMFINTSIEHERGNTNNYPLIDITCGGFNFIGCSIITNGTAFAIKYDFNSPSVLVHLNQCKFELVGDSVIAFATTGTTSSHSQDIYITDCAAYLTSASGKLIDLNSKARFTITNFKSNPYRSIVYAHNTNGVTVGSVLEPLSFIHAKNSDIVPDLEAIYATECIIDDNYAISTNNRSNVTSYSYNNSTVKQPIRISTRPNSAGNRIGRLNIVAPKQYRIGKFGVESPGNYSVSGYTYTLYALPDSMTFDAFDPAGADVVELGTFTATSSLVESAPTAFLNNTIIGYATNYTEGKYVLTGKDGSDNASFGAMFVEFV